MFCNELFPTTTAYNKGNRGGRILFESAKRGLSLVGESLRERFANPYKPGTIEHDHYDQGVMDAELGNLKFHTQILWK